MWYIYTLESSSEIGIVRYVGKARNPQRRLASHISSAISGRDKTYCGNWKRSVLSAGSQIVMNVVESGSGPGWTNAEKTWISFFRTVSDKLTNHTDGGEGFTGKHSSESKKKISAANLGRKQSAASVEKRALARRGWVPSAEWREKMRVSHLGYKLPEEQKLKISISVKAAIAKNPALRENWCIEAKRRMADPAVRTQYSELMKKVWSDPQLRASRIEAMKAAHAKKRELGVRRKGRIHSEATRRKIGDAQKLYRSSGKRKSER